MSLKGDLKKHTLFLREGDWDYLESIFRPNGVSTSVAVRTLVSNYVDKKKEEERKAAGAVPPLDLDIES